MVSIRPTLSRHLSRIAYDEAPFFRLNEQGFPKQAWLKLDLSIRHASLVFSDIRSAEAPAPAPVLDSAAGMMFLPLPAEISGYHAALVLQGERGSAILAYLLGTSFFDAEEGVLVEQPDIFKSYVLTLIGLFQDHSGFEMIANANQLKLAELDLRGESMAGDVRWSTDRIERIYCKITKRALLTQADVDEAVAARVRKSAAKRCCLWGLAGRLRKLMEIAHGGDKQHVEPQMEGDAPNLEEFLVVDDGALRGDLSQRESGAEDKVCIQCNSSNNNASMSNSRHGGSRSPTEQGYLQGYTSEESRVGADAWKQPDLLGDLSGDGPEEMELYRYHGKPISRWLMSRGHEKPAQASLALADPVTNQRPLLPAYGKQPSWRSMTTGPIEMPTGAGF